MYSSQNVNSVSISIPSVQKQKSEPYTINETGHFVGSDGYVVPKNFAEFFDREPLSVRRFLMKKLHRQVVDEVVLDMEQDLLLHLHYLPEKSKHRLEAKTDIVMCFDPERHHGASTKRFHNYLALCMNNRFCTILHKQKKNPIYNPSNLSITNHHGDNVAPSFGEATDEYIHANSSTLSHRSQTTGGEANVHKIFIDQFREYVARYAPEVMPMLEAIGDTNSLKDARIALGMNSRLFDKHRETLDLLQDCFKRGENFAENRNAAKNRRNARIRTMRDTKKTKKGHRSLVAA